MIGGAVLAVITTDPWKEGRSKKDLATIAALRDTRTVTPRFTTQGNGNQNRLVLLFATGSDRFPSVIFSLFY